MDTGIHGLRTVITMRAGYWSRKSIFYIFLLSLAFIEGCGNKHVSLGKYKWQQCSYNESILVDKSGKVIVGKGEIELWGSFPYIWGQVFIDNKSKFFIINQETNNVSFVNGFTEFQREAGISVNLEELVTFQDLCGQWANQNKIEQLNRLLKKKE